MMDGWFCRTWGMLVRVCADVCPEAMCWSVCEHTRSWFIHPLTIFLALKMCRPWRHSDEQVRRGRWPILQSGGQRQKTDKKTQIFSDYEESILVRHYDRDLGAGSLHGRWLQEANLGGRETETGKGEKPTICVLVMGCHCWHLEVNSVGTLWATVVSHLDVGAGDLDAPTHHPLVQGCLQGC